MRLPQSVPDGVTGLPLECPRLVLACSRASLRGLEEEDAHITHVKTSFSFSMLSHGQQRRRHLVAALPLPNMLDAVRDNRLD